MKPIALADLKQEGFSSSQSLAIHVASKKFVKDASDDEVLEEEILVEDLTPDKRADELKLEAQRVRQEGLLAEKAAREAEHAERAAREEERRRRQQEEEEERRKREEAAKETEEQRLARVLAETTKLREQEQLQLQAKLRREKEAIEAERAFAAKALDVALRSSSSSAAKKEPMRNCMRCDKETPSKDLKCVHCGFQATLSGMFSF